ncbi:hypothetical protein [Actinacidiphila oryziradicis]|uniref:Uncharacterized protein n=1 Tax=Actinacidiphila oryziradicis TaxID=2571141 RepID=A0A4U0SKP2_9ACTN|nr:hypothetical protein [Actinacidiphila oryziradicis]TKA10404.1 hypothetical protein FCI23_17075 [Actinacidiphila oryziradicis]
MCLLPNSGHAPGAAAARVHRKKFRTPADAGSQTMTVDSVRASAWDSGTSQTGAIKGIGDMCADVAGASDTAPTGIRLTLTPFS